MAKALGEIDLAALAIRLPRSSFVATRGGADKESTPLPPGEIDLAAFLPSARSFERLIPETSASQVAAPPPSCGASGEIDLAALATGLPRSKYWRDPDKRKATRRLNITVRQKQRLAGY
jgi:hypothetical protein